MRERLNPIEPTTTALVKANKNQSDPLAPAGMSPHYGYRENYDEASSGGGYARLREYWRSVRNHIWLVLGTVSLITVLAALYMARQPDVYEAYARVQVDLEISNPAMGAIKSNSVILNSSYQDPTYFNTQLQILSSAGLLSRVIKTLDLEHNQAFLRPQSLNNRSTWETLKRMVGFGSKDPEPVTVPDSS